MVTRHLDLARKLGTLIDAAKDFERLAPVTLSIVCFRYVPSNRQGDEPAIDRLNKVIMETVQSGGEAFLSSTILSGRFALRACVLNYQTNEADLAALVNVVRRVGEQCTMQF